MLYVKAGIMNDLTDTFILADILKKNINKKMTHFCIVATLFCYR